MGFPADVIVRSFAMLTRWKAPAISPGFSRSRDCLRPDLFEVLADFAFEAHADVHVRGTGRDIATLRGIRGAVIELCIGMRARRNCRAIFPSLD